MTKEEKPMNFPHPVVYLIFIIVIIVLLLNIQSFECKGIGGFVYKEIEWAEQTYNILEENCKQTNEYIGGLFYDNQKKQFYCFIQYDCINGDECRNGKHYFPIKNIE